MDAQSTSRRRSDSCCGVNPRMDDPSKVRFPERLQKKFLIVIEHVKAAFNVREAQRDGLDVFLFFQPRSIFLLQALQRWPFRRAVSPSGYLQALQHGISRKLFSSSGLCWSMAYRTMLLIRISLSHLFLACKVCDHAHRAGSRKKPTPHNRALCPPPWMSELQSLP